MSCALSVLGLLGCQALAGDGFGQGSYLCELCTLSTRLMQLDFLGIGDGSTTGSYLRRRVWLAQKESSCELWWSLPKWKYLIYVVALAGGQGHL